eukprot:823418_1
MGVGFLGRVFKLKSGNRLRDDHASESSLYVPFKKSLGGPLYVASSTGDEFSFSELSEIMEFYHKTTEVTRVRVTAGSDLKYSNRTPVRADTTLDFAGEGRLDKVDNPHTWKI